MVTVGSDVKLWRVGREVGPLDVDPKYQGAGRFDDPTRLVGILYSDLPHELVGRHRRLRLGDVLAYKSRRAIERQKALDELTRLDAALGAYD